MATLLPQLAHAQLPPLAEALRQRVDEARYVSEGVALVTEGAGVAAFYEARAFAPAWQHPDQRRALADALSGLLDDGLEPLEYPVDLSSSPLDIVTAAQLDWRTTESLLLALRHLTAGRLDPQKLDPSWEVAPRSVDMNALAMAASVAVDQPDQIAELLQRARPASPLYAALRRALAELRVLEAAGGWPAIGEGPTLEPDSSDPRVTALRQRLYLGGYLPTARTMAVDPLLYDAELQEAVRRFQNENYLEADARIGRGTQLALDLPVSARISQLQVNLERARWHLHELQDRLLLVDIAGYRATLFQGSTPLWSGRVQVGRSVRPTPVLKSRVTYVTLNPTWTVPPTILRKDILPKLRRGDMSYLTSHQLRVLDSSGHELDPASVDWQRPGAVVLRQAPGSNNALGRVVIRFPNEHMVYMHDTPSQSLFEREQRAFSSGCIRVENALQLVELLLADPLWDRARIDAALATGTTQTVSLAQPVPILLLYWTVDLLPDGRIVFKPDIYARDPVVARALQRAET